jgi:hypothetical protein
VVDVGVLEPQVLDDQPAPNLAQCLQAELLAEVTADLGIVKPRDGKRDQNRHCAQDPSRVELLVPKRRRQPEHKFRTRSDSDQTQVGAPPAADRSGVRHVGDLPRV